LIFLIKGHNVVQEEDALSHFNIKIRELENTLDLLILQEDFLRGGGANKEITHSIDMIVELYGRQINQHYEVLGWINVRYYNQSS